MVDGYRFPHPVVTIIAHEPCPYVSFSTNGLKPLYPFNTSERR
jgi:hypothetical protein